jgi:hypothetical protein
MRPDATQLRSATVLGEILEPLDRIHASLSRTREAVAAIFRTAEKTGRPVRRPDLAGLRPLLYRHLAEHGPLIAGTGVAFAPDVLQDAPRWLEWYWRSRPGALPAFLDVELDPTRPDFYDYEREAWFRAPRHIGGETIVGPHVEVAT